MFDSNALLFLIGGGLNKTFSIFLDLARFLASLLVFFYHSEQILRDSRLSIIASFGHDAVVFFFVLSGFVIGYVSDCKEKTFSEYAIARLARLYSVAIPSLILVCALVVIGCFYYPDKYSFYADREWLKIIFSSLFFLNQSWLMYLAVPTNGPYWSISYEAWYYLLFGVLFYFNGFWKYFLFFIAACVAGPRIILLAPIWLYGFICYKLHGGLVERKLSGYFSIALSISLYLLIRVSNFDDFLFGYSTVLFGGRVNANEMLGFSERFLPDYLIGLLWVYMFYGFYMIRNDMRCFFNKFEIPIRNISAYTFSLYLFHFPLLIFFSVLTDNTEFVILSCLSCIFVLGYFTERKKIYLTELATRLVKLR